MENTSPFVGRADSARALRETGGRARVVTVYGPSGVGKTRLVHEALRRDHERLWWCDLDPYERVEPALQLIGDTLGIEPDNSEPALRIGRVLAEREGVLVLDGAERVGAALVRWLATWTSGPARLVITSTAPLGWSGETPLELPPLALEAAVELWCRLTRADDGPETRRLIARLDGLPRSLCWVANRASLLAGDAVTGWLRAWLSEDTHESWQSRALTESLDGLSDELRNGLERLSLYDSGVATTALSDVAVGIDDVALLQRKALVHVASASLPNAPPRVVVYWPVRQRLRRELRARGRFEAAMQEHASAVMLRCLDAKPAVIRVERAELELIARRSVSPELIEAACVQLASLALDEGSARELAEQLAALPPASPDALLALARLERRLGRIGAARRHAQAARGERPFAAALELAHLDRQQSETAAALAGYRALSTHASDARERAIALGELGRMLQSVGQNRDAQRHHAEALALSRELGDEARAELEASLHARATHRAGDVAEAVVLHQRALAAHRARQSRRLEAAELGHLGFCHHELGEHDEAERHFRASIAGLAAVGDLVLEAIERSMLARLLCDCDRLAEAELELAAARALAVELDMPRLVATQQLVEGLIAWGRGNREAAHACLEAAASVAHAEVGFEALASAMLAFIGDPALADERLRASEVALTAESAAGLHAALAVWRSACGLGAADFDRSLCDCSSDLRRALRLTEAVGPAVLTIAADGRSFQWGAGEVPLGRRAAPRRLLLALAAGHVEQQGRVLSFDALVAAGWPDEKIQHEAARKRLRTAIWTLRKLGLEGAILTRDDGYLLDPDVTLRRD